MRPLKFSAWDKVKNKWIVRGFSIIGEVTVFDMLMGYSIEGFNDIVIVQWTNLKDSDDIDIYEGDIIFDENWWWGPCSIEYRSGRVGPCEGDNVMEWGLVRKNGSGCHNLWNGKDVKVIGNIFENMELTGVDN